LEHPQEVGFVKLPASYESAEVMQPSAWITKMKEGRTHLAHKAEQAVDMRSGAVLAVTLQEADAGDTATVTATLAEAGENVAELIGGEAEKRLEEDPQVNLNGIEEVVADNGYHSGETLAKLQGAGVRTYISEKKQNGRRHWEGKADQCGATYGNRRRIQGERGKGLLRKRGDLIERSFARCYETGGMRRVHLRGRENILKRVLIHVGAFNPGLLLRSLAGAGTPRELKNRLSRLLLVLVGISPLGRFRMVTGRAEASFPPSRLRHTQNRGYLRYLQRCSKTPGSTTGC
jgi:transposase